MSSKNTSLCEEIKNLPKERMPRQDLWRGIEQHIELDQHKKNQTANTIKRNKAKIGFVPYWGIAASFFLCAFVAIVFSTKYDQANGSSYTVTNMTKVHEKQLNSLLVTFENTPALTDNWQAQLNDLNSAASAIRNALEDDPNNTVLLHMLSKIYEQQLKLVEDVHAPYWQNT